MTEMVLTRPPTAWRRRWPARRRWCGHLPSAGSASTPATCKEKAPKTKFQPGPPPAQIENYGQDAGLHGAKGGHVEELVAELLFAFTVRVGQLLLQAGVRSGKV